MANPNMVKGAPSVNPTGRPRKTDEERAAEAYLRDKTLDAAKRLVQLQSSDDEKIALGAVIAHLRLTVGEVKRDADASGDPVAPAVRQMTRGEMLELVRSGK